jgi:predicted SAM-dependent methyltransferase
MDIEALLKERSGIRLDLGCGENKQGPDWIGMDIRPLPGVDIVWNVEEYPWPLPDGCCLTVLASHLVEHIDPAHGGFLRFMDEVWRVCRVGAQFAISMPYCTSPGFYQDPTHCNPRNEITWAYFTPDHPLWNIYKPKPWTAQTLTWDPVGNMEVVLRKRSADV